LSLDRPDVSDLAHPVRTQIYHHPTEYAASGPVNQGRIQRVAAAMLQFGLLGQQYAAEVEQRTVVGSMVGPAS
jgi:hypothetical protein